MCECRCACQSPTLKVGDVLLGFCYGYFGSDSYDEKYVEAIGRDWVLVRENPGYVGGPYGPAGSLRLYQGDPSDLVKFTREPNEYGTYPEED